MNKCLAVFTLAVISGSFLTSIMTEAQAADAILQIEGTLESGDTQAEDGRLYDDYPFEGKAGQAILIQLESAEFDTYLWLLDEVGKTIATNDDANGETNSQIGIVLPETGTYRVRINAYDETGQGAYRLVINPTAADDPVIRQAEASQLSERGLEAYGRDNHSEAISSFEQALSIRREIGDREGETYDLVNLGIANAALGELDKAIELYDRALSISREIGNPWGEEYALRTQGVAYAVLGDHERAIELYEQALNISREVNDRGSEANALANLGIEHASLGDHERAIELYGQALSISREIGDRWGEAYVIDSLGVTYAHLGNHERAIEFYRQSLSINRELDYRWGEANALANLGLEYVNSGNYAQAIELYQLALIIRREISDRWGEGGALVDLGYLYNTQSQPELAIIFLKAAVAVREDIREDNQELDSDLQQTYVDSVADDYRLLADLLLEQGRIPEAQQVLDLLKLEELREFTDTRAAWTGEGVEYTTSEEPVIDAHGSLIALGSVILTCEDTDCPELDDLYDQRDALTAQYNDQVDQFAATIRANRRDDEDFQDPSRLGDDAKSLLSAYAAEGQTPALIYPFVLEDKLWLVWAIEGRVIGSAEVPVSQGELATAVQRFGELLNAPTRLDELQAQGQQLYDWIIQPLAAELETNGIDHLIFVNDRVTRYIPMAALFDGEQFLIERFQVSTVLAPGVTNTRDRLGTIDQSQVLGLGLSNPVAGFNPLPAVDVELDAIVRSDDSDDVGIYPGQVYLNDAFTFDALKTNVRSHRVLHLATHAAFVPGRADESFIVLGNGDRLTAGDIEDISPRLDNLHLVILSACETALGGATGDGTEITGISSYFLGANDSRAETVIASLWAVSDGSTSLLMQRFYENLALGEYSKAEALRQAQLSFIQSPETLAEATARNFGQRQAQPTTSPLAHPYYWAPFILIGNGL